MWLQIGWCVCSCFILFFVVVVSLSLSLSLSLCLVVALRFSCCCISDCILRNCFSCCIFVVAFLLLLLLLLLYLCCNCFVECVCSFWLLFVFCERAFVCARECIYAFCLFFVLHLLAPPSPLLFRLWECVRARVQMHSRFLCVLCFYLFIFICFSLLSFFEHLHLIFHFCFVLLLLNTSSRTYTYSQIMCVSRTRVDVMSVWGFLRWFVSNSMRVCVVYVSSCCACNTCTHTTLTHAS